MTIALMPAPAARTGKRVKNNPISAGLPDPRPLTDYDVAYSEVGGHSRITVTLHQPCIIRGPKWGAIDCATGATVVPITVTPGGAGDNTIVFDFAGIVPASVAFVDVPYQDMEVQNFQGGFVRPGAKWFRAPK
jgi:hypothetical protein